MGVLLILSRIVEVSNHFDTCSLWQGNRLPEIVGWLPIKLITACPYHHFFGAVRTVSSRLKRYYQRIHARTNRYGFSVALCRNRDLHWKRLRRHRNARIGVCDCDFLKLSSRCGFCEIQADRAPVGTRFARATVVDPDRDARPRRNQLSKTILKRS